MKFHFALFAVAALCTAGTFAQAASVPMTGEHPVLWSVHFDAERLRSGAGAEIFTKFEPALNVLSGGKSAIAGGKLQSLTIVGFEPKKGTDRFPFLADISFSGENGGIVQRFEAISKKREVPIEDLAGFPTIHFAHQGKEVWIAKITDNRVFLSMSHDLLAQALADGAKGFAPAQPTKPDEMLGGNIEIAPLLTANPALRDSELLKLLPHLEFHLSDRQGALDLDASAELDSERSARRAARMIDGMGAGLAMHDPSGIPWDERLAMEQEGARLALHLHLNPDEAKKLLDRFAHEIDNKSKAVKDDE